MAIYVSLTIHLLWRLRRVADLPECHRRLQRSVAEQGLAERHHFPHVKALAAGSVRYIAAQRVPT